jgi:opacity protein-like surface antigen
VTVVSYRCWLLAITHSFRGVSKARPLGRKSHRFGMKHGIVVLLSAMLSLSGISTAQIVRSYGIKVGTSVSSQEWTYAIPFVHVAERVRWGVDLGCSVEFLNIPVLSVLVEAHYAQRGFSDEVTVSTVSNPEGIVRTTLSPRVDYLSLPVLAKVRVDLGNVSPYVVIGPRLDVLLSTKPEGYDVVLDKLKPTDLGITVGVGVEWTVSQSVRIGAEGAYCPGLRDVYSSDLLTVRNRSYHILLTINAI